MSDRPPLLAVLIDADNVPAKYAGAILEEAGRLGETSIRRIYGDFTGKPGGWTSDLLAQHAIQPHHTIAQTKQKNASDIALVIDAMDIMHTGRLDGVVLVSSDSDFMHLAQRLREQGLAVFGMGERKTPESFRNSCKRFIYVENLVQAPMSQKPKNLNRAKQLVLNAIADLPEEADGYHLGALGKALNQRYPDFDARTFGHKKLSDLIKQIDGLLLEKRGNTLWVKET